MTIKTVYKIGYTAFMTVSFVGAVGFVSQGITDLTQLRIEGGENEKLAKFEEYGMGAIAGAAIGMVTAEAINSVLKL